MRCNSCEIQLDDDARFCHVCGSEATNVRHSKRDRRRAKSRDERFENVGDTTLEPASLEQNRLPVGIRPAPGRSPLADEDETVLWTGSFSAKGLIHSWLMAILLSIVMPLGAIVVSADATEWTIILVVLALVWVALATYLAIQKLNVHYELTDQRMIHRSGIFLRRTNRIELLDMDDVSHEQGLIERLFDVGTIEITSSDRSHPAIELPGIDHVENVAMLIDDARRRERLRRGIHIEQI